MELGLSLGDAPRSFGFWAKDRDDQVNTTASNSNSGFCMALGINSNGRSQEQEIEKTNGVHNESEEEAMKITSARNGGQSPSVDPPLQLQLDLLSLALAPLPLITPSHQRRLSWPPDNGSSDGGSSSQMGLAAAAVRGFDVNRLPPPAEDGAAVSFQMDFCIYGGAGNAGRCGCGCGGGGNKRDSEAAGNDVVEAERASSRASDEDNNGIARKKLRLSKQQSAYLEDSFKEHHTLNPKQKLALAKQLNLRPRQIEVWFQNRRARTKLKQTEVDCQYLKRWFETLTKENRRLHKELQELRALKTSNPFYMQLPATTLTMCPSCERVATAITTSVATTTSTTAITPNSTDPSSKATPFPLSRPRFYPLSHPPPQPHQSSAAS